MGPLFPGRDSGKVGCWPLKSVFPCQIGAADFLYFAEESALTENNMNHVG